MAKVEGQSSAGAGWRLGPRGWIVAGVAILAVLVAALIPAVYQAQEAARRIQCTNNLRTISLALHNYHDAYRCFPPAYTVDANGQPMHSWRMLIVPQVEANDIYSNYNLGVAWDHPANTTANTRVYLYVCPSDPDPPGRFTMTNYVMARGPGMFFDPARTQPTRLADITDGAANTIMFVETTRKFPWTAPDDPITVAPPDSHHPGGGHAVMADGSIRFWKSTTSPAVYRAALTIAGGEVVPADEH